jgi:hypothetical protein
MASILAVFDSVLRNEEYESALGLTLHLNICVASRRESGIWSPWQEFVGRKGVD